MPSHDPDREKPVEQQSGRGLLTSSGMGPVAHGLLFRVLGRMTMGNFQTRNLLRRQHCYHWEIWWSA